MSIKAPRPLPKPDTPVLQPNGLMARAWYDYFRELDDATRKLIAASNDYETRITDLETP